TMMWNSGAVAGLTAYIAGHDIDTADFDSPSQQLREDILGAAALSANKAASDYTLDWQKIK
ncbi:MAG: hypothetical protein K2L75_00905, partial [Muribaculaceae bacterium]|nr:hypothetical protein [Muribaculaceae bacterium]